MHRAVQSASGSYRNLQALLNDDLGGGSDLTGGGPLSFSAAYGRLSRGSIDSNELKKQGKIILVSNHLPIRATKREETASWEFEWDEDALIYQAQDGIEDLDIMYVGCLPVELDPDDQDEAALELYTQFNCCVVFLGAELKEKYYKGFCKQQLWPLFHYLLPLSPNSTGRFNPELWQAYVKANKAFADKLVEVVSMDEDFVWLHDYHLLVLPSLLRKRFNRIRLGLFLHSPFPSSEIFRTFPRREEILRSLLNADLLGFHTFDYARHFMSCCSRMLGLEHVASRGSISIEYYGRDVGIKIMPTGVKPERFLNGFGWQDTIWRRGELLSQFKGQTVMIGVDDMDLFKGIELKLLALERVLDYHPEWRGRLALIQVTNAPRSPGKDVQELHDFAVSVVERINAKYGAEGYQPVVWLERSVPLYERIALYSVADVAVVAATRDGMNLVPYEYIVCRQGQPDVDPEAKNSMLVVSEFVGCSPSVSGAIRVNPWSIDSLADGIYTAVKMPATDRHLRHDKHWRYVSQHTVRFWAQSYMSDLRNLTKDHQRMKCYALGLGLDTFRMVALTQNFRRLDVGVLMNTFKRAQKRLLLLDYDGTLVPQSVINSRPTEEALHVLQGLCLDTRNDVYIISGRRKTELAEWFANVEGLGLAAEHGFFFRRAGSLEWDTRSSVEEMSWRSIVGPILQQYTESTDGSYVEKKESAFVWHYAAADPDFGSLQAKELLDHLEGVLSSEPVEVVPGNSIVEVKPQGVSKGGVVERILLEAANSNKAHDVVVCIGDDRSDEDMYTAIEHVAVMPHMPAEVFACTVGQKPSKAPFYVNDTAEVLSILGRLIPAPPASPKS
ncbi:g6589 [Coccomyxa viridis]|uniref:G6589 protein n=1 Tax=Coccomyxa viridis TaxID=1274662 RepID=A0ABP1G0L2_9CHLO